MKTRTTTLVAATMALAMMAATGCSPSRNVTINDEIQQRDAQIAELQEKATEQQAALRAAEREAQEARERAEKAAQEARTAEASNASAGSADANTLPPNAKIGECYARVVIPPTFKTEKARVLVKGSSTKLDVVPAKYEMADEKVLVKEASTRLEVVPATYKWVEERVMVKPERKELQVVPGTYDTVSEKILVSPARSYWKKGRGPVEKVDNATGEIMCLVEEPAKYRTITKRVVKTPETTKTITIPAEYTTIKRQVEATPATTRTVQIPAEYKTVPVRRLVEGAKELKNEIPAEYADVTKEEMVTPSRVEWRQILCETNTTGDVVMQIQRALKTRGFDPGPVDGKIGPQTRTALSSFQKSQNLPTGGNLTMNTLKALKVERN